MGAKTLVTTRNNKVKMGTYAHQNWGGPSGSVGTESNHDLRLLTNYNEKMRIKANGNVGVGTSNPQEKLDVNGTIRIHGSNGKFSVHGDNSRVASKKEYIQFVKTDNSSDGARLYAEGSANQGKLVLAITDDHKRQEAFIIRSEHHKGGVKNIAEFAGDGNVTVNNNLKVNGPILSKNTVQKIQGVSNGVLVHERILWGTAGQNIRSYGTKDTFICQVYKPFGYAVPSKNANTIRKYRIYAIYSDGMKRKGEHILTFNIGTWGRSNKKVTFKLPRTWGTTGTGKADWNRDAYSNWITEAQVKNAHHCKIYARVTGDGTKKGVLRHLVLQSWDFPN